ncbi:CopG family ribbon-helix-helix protein [Rhizobium sp. C1]|uniref:CopG family ribbon-helix-helix protein n=1 Tax=Rhizobium sp. C1 TaxID=1349799 RepID=UPI001E3747CA|nr:ribbon-helix-helix protein, CopG family [Rhizobium sp. C1]MCD2176727.1 ribbon-helix-helix protein, CopG family [Rhizobium sp. C1]
MSALTIRLSDETAEQLDTLAKVQESSRSSLVSRAIEEFIAKENWQIAEIQAGLEEAERADFAKDEDLRLVLDRYRASGR